MLYQESIAPNGGRRRDLFSIFALLLAIIVIETLGAHFDRDASWVFALAHLVSFVALVLFCLLFYRLRISGFRYSFIIDADDPDESEKDDAEEDEDKIELPPCGTFIAERTVGDVGSCIDIIAPEELRALVPYSKDSSRIQALKRCERATRISKKTASVLIYERGGREYGIIMHPSEELAGYISAFLEESAENHG